MFFKTADYDNKILGTNDLLFQGDTPVRFVTWPVA